MTTLFGAAAKNPKLITEIVDAMRSAAMSADVTLSDDPLQFMQLASTNAAFNSNLQSQLTRIAGASGFAFEPEEPVSVPGAEGQLEGIKTLSAPKEAPISMGIAMLFLACALIFAPSTFKAVGGTMFGEGGAMSGVEGLVPFGS